MTEIDYALAYKFCTDTDPGVCYQLRFRTDEISYGNPWQANPTGQLVAVVTDHTRADNGRTRPVSRAGVHFNDVETAVHRDNWPFLASHVVDLDAIRGRIENAGLA